MKKVYPAIFEKDPVGYGIYFPDIEGAVTQAESIAEGLENTADALGDHARRSIRKKSKLARPYRYQ